MSSVETPAVRERDPSNRCSRGRHVSRLDAEFVRDNALAVSGLLVRAVGGETVKPYQPRKILGGAELPGPRVGERQGREGVPPRPVHALAADVPAPGDAGVRRPEPRGVHLRAAAIEHPAAGARAAERPRVRGSRPRLRRESPWCRVGKDDAAHRVGVRARHGPHPKPDESKVLLGVLAKHRKDYAADAKAAAELLKVGDAPRPEGTCPPPKLAAWTSVCRVVLNLHETITTARDRREPLAGVSGLFVDVPLQPAHAACSPGNPL